MLLGKGWVSVRSELSLTVALASQWDLVQTVLSRLLLVFMEGPGQNSKVV